MENQVRFRDIEVWRNPNYHTNMPWDFLFEDWMKRDEKGDFWYGGKGSACSTKVLLQPDFQRGYVWTQEQQIAYIESMLSGSITGREIYLNHPTWGDYSDFPKWPIVCVDGQQRIGAVLALLNNEITAFGHFYSEYSDNLPMNTAYFNLWVANYKTKQEVVDLYLRFNFAGAAHTKEELDKARASLSSDSYE